MHISTRYQRRGDLCPLVNVLAPRRSLPVVGKVVWVSPMGQMGGRRPGVGVQLSEAAENEEIRNKIEATLAGMLESDTPTHTM